MEFVLKKKLCHELYVILRQSMYNAIISDQDLMTCFLWQFPNVVQVIEICAMPICTKTLPDFFMILWQDRCWVKKVKSEDKKWPTRRCTLYHVRSQTWWVAPAYMTWPVAGWRNRRGWGGEQLITTHSTQWLQHTEQSSGKEHAAGMSTGHNTLPAPGLCG